MSPLFWGVLFLFSFWWREDWRNTTIPYWGLLSICFWLCHILCYREGGKGAFPFPLTNFGSMITSVFSSHTKSRFASIVLDGPWRPSWQTQQWFCLSVVPDQYIELRWESPRSSLCQLKPLSKVLIPRQESCWEEWKSVSTTCFHKEGSFIFWRINNSLPLWLP